MTDRIHALTVVLENDMREDDVKALAMAIRMMRNVLQVHEHVSDAAFHTAQERARHEMRVKLYAAINDFERGT